MKANTHATTEKLIENALDVGLSYLDYRKKVSWLAAENSNSGDEKTDALAQYTLLNDKRMKRWDRTLKLSDDVGQFIKSLRKKRTLLVLTESWCGDASPSLPILHKMASGSDNLDLKIVFRDEHPELMDRFLTHGARSIPKVILLETATKNVLGEWGPRATVATQLVNQEKKNHGKIRPGFKEQLQLFYNKDKGRDIISDLEKLLAEIES